MSMETILSAIIAGAVTLIGVLIAKSKSNAVMEYKIEELTREVRKHNGFAEKIPVIQRDIQVLNHRVSKHTNTKGANTMNFNITAGTIARTAVLLLALTNQLLSAMGKSPLPIESATVEQLVTAGITTIAALIAWWKNNSFTKEAIAADAEYDRLRKQNGK